MVQGLAFLSKKSWHTKNFNNQEKVWLAEERKKAEALKTKELQKQIQQELEQQELDAIAGRKSRDRGIDWMYEHGPSSEVAQQDAQKRSEEYLLGKEFVPSGAPKGDLDLDQEQEGLNKVVSSAAAAAASVSNEQSSSQNAHMEAEPSVKERNEAFRVRYEDPMFLVAQQALEKERKLERKKQLLERVTGAVAVDVTELDKQDKNDKKNDSDERKHRHRKKKHKKHRHRSPSYSSDSTSDSERAARKRRRRSRSRERSRACSPPHRTRHPDESRISREIAASDPRYPNPQRERRHSYSRHDEADDRSHRRKRNRSRSPLNYDRERYRTNSSPGHRPISNRRSPPRRTGDYENHYSQYRERSRSPERHPERRREDRSHEYVTNSRSRYESVNVDNRKPPPRSSLQPPVHSTDYDSAAAESDRRYGLQGERAAFLARTTHLGPDQELLQRKRDEKLERKRLQESAARRTRLTPEERARAVREMELNARQREEQRSRLTAEPRASLEDSTPGTSASSASFIQDIQKRTYGLEGISMQERLRQNRHMQQRAHESFL